MLVYSKLGVAVVFAALLFAPFSRIYAGHTHGEERLLCDVFIVGGTTSALAAALTISNSTLSSGKTICYAEPTVWPGGQLTAEGVPAIDFSTWTYLPANQPYLFRDLVASLGGGNEGECWVSERCYLPRRLLDGWVWPAIERATTQMKAKGGKLVMLLNSVVVEAGVEADGGYVTEVKLIQREARDIQVVQNTPFSRQVQDWYSPSHSQLYWKRPMSVTAKVYIDASESADLLVSSSLMSSSSFSSSLSNSSPTSTSVDGATPIWTQGVEVPSEDALTTLPTCTQSITFPFFLKKANASAHLPSRPTLKEERDYSFAGFKWGEIWAYRRVYAVDGSKAQEQAYDGDISNQNWSANDMDDATFLLSPSSCTAPPCLNTTTLDRAELLSYSWMYNYTSRYGAEERWRRIHHQPPSPTSHTDADMVETVEDERTIEGYGFELCTQETAATSTGLPLYPYVRDSRRAVGVDGFRLSYSHLRAGTTFNDTMGLIHYQKTDMHLLDKSRSGCNYPSYLSQTAILPSFLPFRALTVTNRPNLLVAGKALAQTFHASAVTRVHPCEWNSGAAAGIGSLFVMNGIEEEGKAFDVRTLYQNATRLAQMRREMERHAPLQWTEPPTPSH